MNAFKSLHCLMVTLVALVPIEAAAQTHILPRDGVAVASIANDPVSNALPEADKASARTCDQQAATLRQGAEGRNRCAAEASAKHGDVAMTQRQYGEAALHYAAAAGSIFKVRPGEHWQYLEWEALALYQQGIEDRNNRAMALAADRYRALADAKVRGSAEWVKIQLNFANALSILAARQLDKGQFDVVVTAYQLALREVVRKSMPADWALSQPARKGMPLDWALAQTRLGAELEAVRAREAEIARLEEAVAAYQLALQSVTRERMSHEWTLIQMNLAYALSMLARHEMGTKSLEGAVNVWDMCLAEVVSTWPPEWHQVVHSRREGARLEIKLRETK